jgi:hypothetical protein
MTPRSAKPRTGATLVELLVVMSIIAALGALALMLLPAVANSDAARKGAAEVQTTLKISQAMAGSARLPRGVRLIPSTNPALPPGAFCTEMQYLESPPVMVADPQPLVGNRAGNPNGDASPRVEFSYEYYDGNTAALPNSGWTAAGNPPPGAIKLRHCYLYGLNTDQTVQVTAGSTIVLPTLGAWSRVKAGLGSQSNANEVVLEVYPDALLGAASQNGAPPPTSLYRTYHFGVYGPPVPVIGEPTVQLPQNIAIDLSVSVPGWPFNPPQPYYDILFAPSGQLLVTATNPTLSPSGAVLLWVRDYTKVGSMVRSSYPTGAAYANAFRLAGEQQIVGVRNGFVGTAPVLWPDAGGNYATGAYPGPYGPALQQLD